MGGGKTGARLVESGVTMTVLVVLSAIVRIMWKAIWFGKTKNDEVEIC